MAVEHGYMPLGKFSSARDDILHFLCTSDWAEDSFGNSPDYGLYAWRITNSEADVSVENSEFTSVIDEWFEMNQEVTDSPELRAELVGYFMVCELSSGMVNVQTFESEQDLMETYLAEQTRWEEWELQDEED